MSRCTANSLKELLELPVHLLLGLNNEVQRQLEEEKKQSEGNGGGNGVASMPNYNAMASSQMSSMQSQVSSMMGSLPKI